MQILGMRILILERIRNIFKKFAQISQFSGRPTSVSLRNQFKLQNKMLSFVLFFYILTNLGLAYLSESQVLNCRSFLVKKDGNFGCKKVAPFKMFTNFQVMAKSVSGDSSASVGFNVPFPSDYSELLEQVSNLSSFPTCILYYFFCLRVFICGLQEMTVCDNFLSLVVSHI